MGRVLDKIIAFVSHEVFLSRMNLDQDKLYESSKIAYRIFILQ